MTLLLFLDHLFVATGAITAAVIVAGVGAGASLYSGRQAGKGAAQAAAADAAAREALMGQLSDAAYTAAGEVRGIAGEYKAEADQAVGAYRKNAYRLADQFEYTPVRGILDLDENGVSQFDKVFELYASADEARRKRVLGDSEPLLQKAMEDFARLGSGDFSGFLAELRSSEAGIAASTRGGPIGAFANIAAQNRINFMRQGADTSMSIAGLLSSFDTETPTVFQSSLQVTDEARREAERKDTTERLKVATMLDIEQNTLNGRIAAASSFASMRVGAANSLANALAGAAQSGFGGSGGAGIGAALSGQTATAVAGAVNTGVSNYLQYQQSQETNELLKAKIAASKTAPVK